MKLHAQLGFERRGIHAGTHATDDVEPVRIGPPEALGFAIEQRLGVARNPEIGHAPAVELGAVEAGWSDADHGKGMAIDLITCTHNPETAPRPPGRSDYPKPDATRMPPKMSRREQCSRR